MYILEAAMCYLLSCFMFYHIFTTGITPKSSGLMVCGQLILAIVFILFMFAAMDDQYKLEYEKKSRP